MVDKDHPVSIDAQVDEKQKENHQIPTVSGSVLNGSAKKMAKPVYPPAAKAVHVGGGVKIQVIIETDGTDFWAEPISGHPFLSNSARNAACSSQFTPTFLSGQPVRVSGIVVYNFVP